VWHWDHSNLVLGTDVAAGISGRKKRHPPRSAEVFWCILLHFDTGEQIERWLKAAQDQ